MHLLYFGTEEVTFNIFKSDQSHPIAKQKHLHNIYIIVNLTIIGKRKINEKQKLTFPTNAATRAYLVPKSIPITSSTWTSLLLGNEVTNNT